MKKLVIAVFPIILLINGCRTVKFSDHRVGNGNVTTLTYDATRRAIKILYVPSEDREIQARIKEVLSELAKLNTKGPTPEVEKQRMVLTNFLVTLSAATVRPIILAEPPPDVASQFSATFSGKFQQFDVGELSAAEQIVALAHLSAANHAVRDALYRLNEAAVMDPALFSSGEYAKLFAIIMQSVVHMGQLQPKVELQQALRQGERLQPARGVTNGSTGLTNADTTVKGGRVSSTNAPAGQTNPPSGAK